MVIIINVSSFNNFSILYDSHVPNQWDKAKTHRHTSVISSVILLLIVDEFNEVPKRKIYFTCFMLKVQLEFMLLDWDRVTKNEVGVLLMTCIALQCL